jgi:hypothetical protein
VDSDEIVQALAGGTVTLHVSRTWVHSAGLMPVEAEFAAVDDAPTWTIVFCEDGSSVTLSEAGSESKNYTGTRLEGEPLVYDLSPATGGQLVIVRRGSGYLAQITLYGRVSDHAMRRGRAQRGVLHCVRTTSRVTVS